jgi:hypothetical protein
VVAGVVVDGWVVWCTGLDFFGHLPDVGCCWT